MNYKANGKVSYKVYRTLLLCMSSCAFLCMMMSFFGVSLAPEIVGVAVGSPVNFGKTHFIVGQTAAQRCQVNTRKKAVAEVNPQSWIFFTPDDNVRAQLLDLIVHEQESISVAVFVFTDKYIASALIDAFKRGVAVEVVTDATGLRDRYNKIRDLCNAQVPVFVYDAQNGKPGLSSVMHHKFVIFKRNKNNQSYLWTGSCNFTRSACESNQENAILLTNIAHIERFAVQFEALKKRSYLYKK